MEEFNRTASVVATNIQKLVQNVSSMQRMLVHVETQVWGSCVFFFQLKWYPVEKGEGLRSQLRQLQHYTGQLAKDTAGQLKQLADAQVESILSLNIKTKCRSCKNLVYLSLFIQCCSNDLFEVTDSGARLQRERLQDEFTKVEPVLDLNFIVAFVNIKNMICRLWITSRGFKGKLQSEKDRWK